MCKIKRNPVIDGDIVRIPLTRGYEAIVDIDDLSLAESRNWHARVCKSTVYAGWIEKPTKTLFLLHRQVMDCPDGFLVDHINGDGLDNRKSNLRIVTVKQNLQNQRKNKTNASGYKGVSKNRNKWRAFITVDDKKISLGVFDYPEDAHVAYVRAARKYYGEYYRAE